VGKTSRAAESPVVQKIGKFIALYKWLLTAAIGLGGLPALTSLVTSLGPPWPSRTGVSLTTGLAGRLGWRGRTSPEASGIPA